MVACQLVRLCDIEYIFHEKCDAKYSATPTLSQQLTVRNPFILNHEINVSEMRGT